MKKKIDKKKHAENLVANMKLLIVKSTSHLDEKLDRIMKLLGEED